MNNKYAVKLNLDLKLFKSTLPPVDVIKSIPIWADNVVKNPPLATHFTLPREYWSDDLTAFFHTHEQLITDVEVFYTFPNGKLSIHVDDTEPGDFTKINWIFGGKDSQMIWYNTIAQSKEITISPNYRNTPSIQYKPDEVVHVYSNHLQGPNIVQVGCPHSIMNSDEERFCVSVVFKNKKTTNFQKRPTIQESIEIFKDYIIGDPGRI